MRRVFRYAQTPRSGKQRLARTLAVLTIIILIASALINSRLQPILTDMAISKVTNISLRAINEAVDEEISTGNLEYDKMIFFEKDVDGNITALKTNMIEINHMKTELLDIIAQKINETTVSELSIPVGNMIGSNIFSGRGPLIPIKILSVSYSNANFSNAFSSAGINQTRHQILLDVAVDITILLPSGTTSTTVNYQICVAETVIVGSVPDNYAYFSNYDSSGEAVSDYYTYVK